MQGVGFSTASATTSTADPNAVWLEGTAHLVAALLTRVLLNRSPYLLGDLEVIFTLLQNCAYAQHVLGAEQTVAGRTIPVGLGLVAASSVLDTGFYYTYGPSLHIGATGWYLLAGLAANPFQLAYRVIPSYL